MWLGKFLCYPYNVSKDVSRVAEPPLITEVINKNFSRRR